MHPNEEREQELLMLFMGLSLVNLRIIGVKEFLFQHDVNQWASELTVLGCVCIASCFLVREYSG